MGCFNSKVQLSNVTVNQYVDRFNKDEVSFNKAKAILKNIMDRYYLNEINKKSELKYVVTMGPKGKGKSTLANILYDVNETDLRITCGGGDGTVSIKDPVKTKFNDLQLIDAIGFNPDPANLAKLIVLLVDRGIFPDFFVYPGERSGDLSNIDNVLELGVADILFVPFQPSVYHALINLISNKVLAIKESFNPKYRDNLIQFPHVEYYFNLEEKPIFSDQKMKENFISLFFFNKEFISYTFEEVSKNILNVKNKVDRKETIEKNELKTMLYSALVMAIQSIPNESIRYNNGNYSFEIADEVSFFKSNR